MPSTRVAVIGAGLGGLAAAIRLAARGVAVTVLEREQAPGGKLRTLGPGIDSGPTVLTLREVLDELFAAAGRDSAQYLRLERADVLARHAWSESERLDLFADHARTVAAVGDFAGAAAARGYERFAADAERLHAALEAPFLRAERPRNALALAAALGFGGCRALVRASPFRTLWDVLGGYFADPRLRQLFGRYATYCGSSPLLAPATLMVIAHVERRGVWLVEGGMACVAQALARLARELGVRIECGTGAARLAFERGKLAGVVLDDGDRVAADAVVANVDVAALAAGLFGPEARRAAARHEAAPRSLSALTWSLEAEAAGFPLSRHNVFFSGDYPREFAELRAARCPSAPTVYVCAQDRGARIDDDDRADSERVLVLVNAPANGDRAPLRAEEIDRCKTTTWKRLEACGLRLRETGSTIPTTPADFARLFPATGGALYGAASHGWRASFARPTARTPVPRLYLAGGSAHPGAGVPMAMLSGQLAATALLTDLASTRRFRRTAMHGGTSTH